MIINLNWTIGANPPLNTAGGYFGRIWRNHGVDKVIEVKRGIFLVRFKTMESSEKIQREPIPFFDCKPVLIKRWTPDGDVNSDDLMTIPIWILLRTHYKYWSMQTLKILTRDVGKMMGVDHCTADREN
ncbi:Phosphatidylinositol 3-kinase regulatory subunit beta [Bienertia sinuspersici]